MKSNRSVHRRAVGLARSVVGGRADRHPAHRLDPAGDHHLHRARHHRLGAEVDRLLGRAALPVDGGAGDGVGKARGEGGVAPDVHGLLADGHRAPVDDVFDQRGVEVVALDECAQRLGGQVDRVPAGEPPVPLPDRGPDDIDDHGARHDPIVSDALVVAGNLAVCQISRHGRSSATLRAMDLRYTDDQEAFRADARAWLVEHAPAPGSLPSLDTAAGFEAHRRWERTMAAERWSVVSWPEEYGGRGVGLFEWLVFEEEYWRARAPNRVSQNGIFLLAPTLFEFGTDEQKRRFLPPMASGEEIWCQGWSEPDAGSDLAGITSRARRAEREGGWVLNGQKTWASRGAFAEWCFGLFRTDPEAERHRGLTYFLVDLSSPGVTVRPIPQLDGETGFAEIFFEDVFVPDAQVLGGVDRGWQVAMATAGSERGLSLRSPARYTETASTPGRSLCGTPDGRPLARRAQRRRGGAGLDRRRGLPPPHALDGHSGARRGAPSVPRRAPTRSTGPRPTSPSTAPRSSCSARTPKSRPATSWLDGYLFALAGPIYAGTNEIQRNVVAERMLGLPRN